MRGAPRPAVKHRQRQPDVTGAMTLRHDYVVTAILLLARVRGHACLSGSLWVGLGHVYNVCMQGQGRTTTNRTYAFGNEKNQETEIRQDTYLCPAAFYVIKWYSVTMQMYKSDYKYCSMVAAACQYFVKES